MRPILQIIISLLLMGLVLIQERSSGVSGILGGGGSGTPYYARRGVEKGIFYATIIATILFAGLALLNLLA
ncbi:MAG: preprotein translocase subunit SecG [Candidatus Jorgensenbacteria bacterium]|nr:preprotein translocase subunit SecG [Candidatus Jorgensenbacteria bacterium]